MRRGDAEIPRDARLRYYDDIRGPEGDEEEKELEPGFDAAIEACVQKMCSDPGLDAAFAKHRHPSKRAFVSERPEPPPPLRPPTEARRPVAISHGWAGGLGSLGTLPPRNRGGNALTDDKWDFAKLFNRPGAS